MNNPVYRDMLEAIRLTRAGKLADATAFLQRLLRGETPPHSSFVTNNEPAEASSRRMLRHIDLDLAPETVETKESGHRHVCPRRWEAAPTGGRRGRASPKP